MTNKGIVLAIVVLIAAAAVEASMLAQAASMHPEGVARLQQAGLLPADGRQRGSGTFQCPPQGYPKQVLANYAPARAAFDGYWVGKGPFFAVFDYNGDGVNDMVPLFSVEGVLWQFWNDTLGAQVTRFYTRLPASGGNPPGPVQAGDYVTYMRPYGEDSHWCVYTPQMTFGGDLFSAAQFVNAAPGDAVHLGETNTHQNHTTGVQVINEYFDYRLTANDPRSNLQNGGRCVTTWQLYAQDADALPGSILLFNTFDLRKVQPFDPLVDVWPL